MIKGFNIFILQFNLWKYISFIEFFIIKFDNEYQKQNEQI